MTLRISWSGLRTHNECKQKGMLQREYKQTPLQNTRNFFPGTVTDRVVRDWLSDDPENNPGIMKDMVVDVIEREKQEIDDGNRGVMLWKDSKDKDDVIEVCQTAVINIEDSLNKYVLPFDYQTDYHFQSSMDLPHPGGGTETVILNGYMDIIVRDSKGRWAVWDVKHTKDNSYWKKTQGQLGFYDLAVNLETGSYTAMTGLLQPLCKEKVKPIKLTADSRSVMLSSITSMANDVWNKDEAPRTDNKFCYNCEVRHACSKFKPRVVEGKKVAMFGG